MYYIGRLLSQHYLNSVESRLLRKLWNPRTRKEVRLRAPFSISHPELIDIGVGTEFWMNARINAYPDLVDNMNPENCRLSIGKNCYFGNRVTFLIGDSITVGNDVLVADDVSIISYEHGIDPESVTPYMDQPLNSSSISIGDNCWIGEKATITSGVTIGKGCVVGAMSVVTKDVPDYSVVAGVPAAVIKEYDFNDHIWKRV